MRALPLCVGSHLQNSANSLICNSIPHRHIGIEMNYNECKVKASRMKNDDDK